MASVIDALKRLERAGDEHSRTTEKLRQAADTLADRLAEQLSQYEREAPHPDCIVILPRDYIYAIAPRRLTLPLEPPDGESVGSGTATRASALRFAKDVATGWLDELAEWLEQAIAEDQQATQTLAERIS